MDAGAAPLTEVTLADGLRADVMALGRDGAVTIVECKSSVADFRADRKWRGYLAWCDAFLFAAPPDFPAELLPDDAGVLVADAWGAELARPGARTPLAPARRKAVTLRFARAAALRLRAGADPGFAEGV